MLTWSSDHLFVHTHSQMDGQIFERNHMVIFYHYIGSTVVLHPAKFRGVVNAAEVRGSRRHAWMYLESMGVYSTQAALIAVW